MPLTVLGFQPATLLEKRLRERFFSVNFGKIFKNIFWQNTSGWLPFVFIGEFWEVFEKTSFIDHIWEIAYFMYKLQNFIQQI